MTRTQELKIFAIWLSARCDPRKFGSIPTLESSAFLLQYRNPKPARIEASNSLAAKAKAPTTGTVSCRAEA